jgi:hypothetical protein
MHNFFPNEIILPSKFNVKLQTIFFWGGPPGGGRPEI